jgi:hypothetical protein
VNHTARSFLPILGWFRGLFFDPEDGRDIALRNVGWLTTNYTALYSRGQNSSSSSLSCCSYFCFTHVHPAQFRTASFQRLSGKFYSQEQEPLISSLRDNSYLLQSNGVLCRNTGMFTFISWIWRCHKPPPILADLIQPTRDFTMWWNQHVRHIQILKFRTRTFIYCGYLEQYNFNWLNTA